VADLGGWAFLQGIRRGEIGRQVELELVADDEIDTLLILKRAKPGLSITAGDGDEGVRRVPECLPDQVSRRPLRIDGDRTSVENQEVRGLPELDQMKSSAPESLAEDR
jgi:hypothetical protein